MAQDTKFGFPSGDDHAPTAPNITARSGPVHTPPEPRAIAATAPGKPRIGDAPGQAMLADLYEAGLGVLRRAILLALDQAAATAGDAAQLVRDAGHSALGMLTTRTTHGGGRSATV